MINKNEKSNFPYSYEEVDQLSLQTYSLMQRDAAEFSLFGIDQVQQDSFKALSDSFNKRDFDEQFLLMQKSKTYAKDKVVDEIRIDIYNLEMKVDFAWKAKGESFKSLKLGGVSKDNDLELSTKAKLCVNLLTESIVDFAEVGITLEMLEALSNKASNLRQLIDQQRLAEYKRHIAQSERLALANELYSEMMRFRNLGRKMWATTNYELSQSYVMPKKYSGSGGSDPIPDEPEEEVVTDTTNS